MKYHKQPEYFTERSVLINLSLVYIVFLLFCAVEKLFVSQKIENQQVIR